MKTWMLLLSILFAQSLVADSISSAWSEPVEAVAVCRVDGLALDVSFSRSVPDDVMTVSYSVDGWGELSGGEDLRAALYLLSPLGVRDKLLVDGLEGTGTYAWSWRGDVAHGGECNLEMVVYDAVGIRDERSLRCIVGLGLFGWQSQHQLAVARAENLTVDLAEGVRCPKFPSRILPFAYSSTNFTGEAGTSADSTVQIRLVQLSGEGADVSQWTDEVPETETLLFSGKGESTVRWEKPKRAVWKAEYEIMTDGQIKHQEYSIFDLRNFSVGLLFFVR